MANEYNLETDLLETSLVDDITDIGQETNTETQLKERKWQIPTNQVAAEFGEVNVRKNVVNSEGIVCHVELTIAMEPQGHFAEGWRTGLALDASASMKRSYGRKVEARVDPALLTDYIKQGRLKSYLEDGEPVRRIQREAFVEIQERGYEINYTANILQPLVQDFTAYLAGSLDGIGKTALIYWGCGKGDEIQILGEFDALGCQQLTIAGPATFALGKTTKLLPAIAYFIGHYHQAKRGMFIFLTDGRIDDLVEVKNYTRQLALEIATGKRNYLKLILIGIGQDVDRYQLQELDDFDTGLDIDIWDYKIASEMTNLTQIFAEVVNENQVIAESGKIYDDRGNCVKSYLRGLPACIDFTMDNDAQWFELEVNGQRIRQELNTDAVAIAPLAQKSLMEFELQAIASRDQVRQNAIEQNVNHPITQNDLLTEQLDSHEEQRLFKYWKLLAALLIGAALLGTAIIFGILIRRSDDNRLQNPVLNSNSTFSPVSKPSSKPSNLDAGVKNSPNPTTNPITTSTTKPNNISANSSSNSATKTEDSVQGSIKPTISKSTALSQPITAPIKSPPNSPTSNQSKSPKISPPLPTPELSSTTADTTTVTLPITNPDAETTIFFAADEVSVNESESLKIEQFWQKIQGKTGVIRVSGHTDRTGEYSYNLDISKERANEVVRLLRDRGVDDNYKVTFEALSWLQPKDTNTNPSLNRRVVIQFKATSFKQ